MVYTSDPYQKILKIHCLICTTAVLISWCKRILCFSHESVLPDQMHKNPSTRWLHVIKSELIAITLFWYYWLFHIRLIGIYNRGTIHIHVLLYVNSYLRVLILTRSDIELSLLNSMKNKYFMSNIIVQFFKRWFKLSFADTHQPTVRRTSKKARPTLNFWRCLTTMTIGKSPGGRGLKIWTVLLQN